MYKILVVDDLHFNITLISETLRDHYIVLIATDGLKAIKVAREKKPDLILMDIIMPEMDGIEACKRLKSDAETAGIPIIFITSKNEVKDVIKGLEVGGVDYISKPFNPEELLLRIESQLKKKTRPVITTDVPGRAPAPAADDDTLRKLMQENKELIELNERKSYFSSIVVQELKNTLTEIMGFAMLLSTKLPAKTKEATYSGIIYESAKKMQIMTNNLLGEVNTKDSKAVLNFEEINVVSMIKNIIKNNHTLASNKKQKLWLNTDHQQQHDYYSFLIKADRVLFTQIMETLLINAMKYTPGEETIRIYLKLIDRNNERFVDIEIADRGPGFTKKEIGDLFETFQRLSEMPRGNEKSKEYGLFLIKKLIELHKGELYIKPTKDKGASIHVLLPAVKTKKDSEDNYEEDNDEEHNNEEGYDDYDNAEEEYDKEEEYDEEEYDEEEYDEEDDD